MKLELRMLLKKQKLEMAREAAQRAVEAAENAKRRNWQIYDETLARFGEKHPATKKALKEAQRGTPRLFKAWYLRDKVERGFHG